MPRFDAVLFDLDGTILHTLPGIAASMNRALDSCHRPTHTVPEIASYIGNGIRVLTARALAQGRDDPRYEEIYAAYNADYALHSCEDTAVFPGMTPLLDALRARGLKLAVVTNKNHEHAVPMVEHFFGPRFALTLGRRDGVPAKPDPAAALSALSSLGVSPERALYVGDSPVDGETAKNAGMACVLVDWGYRERAQLLPCGALSVISTPEALLQFIE